MLNHNLTYVYAPSALADTKQSQARPCAELPRKAFTWTSKLSKLQKWDNSVCFRILCKWTSNSFFAQMQFGGKSQSSSKLLARSTWGAAFFLLDFFLILSCDCNYIVGTCAHLAPWAFNPRWSSCLDLKCLMDSYDISDHFRSQRSSTDHCCMIGQVAFGWTKVPASSF